MASTQQNTIQPGRIGPDLPAAPAVFAGTVTGVKQEKGVQTVEVQYSQGKIRFQADGDFQAGEKIRLSFPGGNTVQIAKGAAAAAQEDPGVSYTLPQNLPSLRAFEQSVSQWLANTETPVPSAPGTVPAPGMPASAAQAQTVPGTVTLPELLLQVMDKAGGQEFLSQALATLDRNMVGAMMDALDATPGDAGPKSALMDMLRLQGRASDVDPSNPRSASGNNSLPQTGPKNLDGHWPAEAGAGAAPWFGRVVEKDAADAFLSPRDRLQFGGDGAPKSDPMHRYLLDVGGRTMEAYSAQDRKPGELADFTLEAHGGRMQARFLDPAETLPAGLRADFANASPAMRQALQLSSHYLQEFKDEPYFEKLVKDFAEALDQSGRMDADPAASDTASAAMGTEAATAGAAANPAPAASNGPPPAGLPDQKELDNLLRLFVAFPRDTQQPEKQARIWGDAIRNPQAMMDLLKTLRPDQETPLLRQGTGLRMAPDLPSPSAAALSGSGGEAGTAPETTPETMAGWLRKQLPESFKTSDLLRLAEDNSPFAGAAGKDHDPSKFLLQAVANSFPKDEEMRQGQPAQFYFYQGQDWRGLQVTWEKGRKEDAMGSGAPKSPLQVRVETQAQHMGKVNVGVTWEPKGAKIDFKNQYHDVRDLFTQSLPELEKSLDYMDFKIAAWTYDLLPEDANPPSQGAWMRPAGLSDGANLDLFG